MTVANGNGAAPQRVLKSGVWAPSPAFFDDNEDLGELKKSEAKKAPPARASAPPLPPTPNKTISSSLGLALQKALGWGELGDENEHVAAHWRQKGDTRRGDTFANIHT